MRDNSSLQRKPFLAPIWLSFLSAVIAIGCLCFAGWAAWVWATANSTMIIVVRPAESGSDGKDVPLDSADQVRADLLSRMLGQTRATGRLEAIYTSPTQEGRMLAAPLGSRLGITPIVTEPATGSGTRAWVRRISREHAGGRILIVGRRATVPEIVRVLSENDAAPGAEDDAGTLYIISVPRIGRANVLRLQY